MEGPTTTDNRRMAIGIALASTALVLVTQTVALHRFKKLHHLAWGAPLSLAMALVIYRMTYKAPAPPPPKPSLPPAPSIDAWSLPQGVEVIEISYNIYGTQVVIRNEEKAKKTTGFLKVDSCDQLQKLLPFIGETNCQGVIVNDNPIDVELSGKKVIFSPTSLTISGSTQFTFLLNVDGPRELTYVGMFPSLEEVCKFPQLNKLNLPDNASTEEEQLLLFWSQRPSLDFSKLNHFQLDYLQGLTVDEVVELAGMFESPASSLVVKIQEKAANWISNDLKKLILAAKGELWKPVRDLCLKSWTDFLATQGQWEHTHWEELVETAVQCESTEAIDRRIANHFQNSQPNNVALNTWQEHTDQLPMVAALLQ